MDATRRAVNRVRETRVKRPPPPTRETPAVVRLVREWRRYWGA